jgi:hypothetical protein
VSTLYLFDKTGKPRPQLLPAVRLKSEETFHRYSTQGSQQHDVPVMHNALINIVLHASHVIQACSCAKLA